MVNVAASVDGKIDTVARRGAAISGEWDRERVQRLRAEVDAVMVGRRTLLDEDPRLTVRAAELIAERIARGVAAQPAKVGIVRDASEVTADSRFLRDGSARVILFSASPGERENVEVYHCAGVDGRVDLVAVMFRLRQLGIERLLVEGGGSLIAALLGHGLVDEVLVYIAPVIFGGASAPTLADGGGGLAVRLERSGVEPQPDGGVLLRYKVEQS